MDEQEALHADQQRGPPPGDLAGATVAGGATRARAEETNQGDAGPAADAVRVEGEVAPNAAPGTRSDVAAWVFREQVEAHRVSLSGLPELVADDANFVWVDLSGYGQRDLETLASLLGLPRNAVHTALSVWQRPRLDLFDDQFFVAVTVPYREPGAYRVQASELDLFVGNNFLVSAHKRPLPFMERVLARSRRRPELASLDSAFMLYLVLDELLAYGEGLSEGLENEIEEMEERALRDTSDTFLDDLLHLKRYSFAVGRLMDHHEELFAAFLRPDFSFVSGSDTEPYFHDLDARLARLLDKIRATREAVNDAFDIYVSQMSHRTNQVMKILTLVSTVLLPATVILGVFGTNFQGVPLYTSTGFLIMLLLIVLISGVILWAFHRQHWF
ncbi:MAG TPA: magnesium transporter CorA family protein [Thermomicrobiaceae bacterium]|nr:magnesium transporter CorA family protein [Thermomicrobiaceae bacterium]